MGKFTVLRTKNYTTMCNYHLRDRSLSIKAKGLLSIMLSLPDDWDYSINGLVTISKDGKDSVISALNELKTACYIKMTQGKNSNGQFGSWDYDVYEIPYNIYQYGKSESGRPNTENPNTGNPPQLNTNINRSIINNTPTINENIKEQKTKTNITPSIPQGDVIEEMSQEKILFEEFRKIYLGTKRGLDVEFANFCKKHKDWREVLPYLKVNYERQIEAKKSQRGSIDPRYEKHLQTYINQRCWEEEISYGSNTTNTTSAHGTHGESLQEWADRQPKLVY